MKFQLTACFAVIALILTTMPEYGAALPNSIKKNEKATSEKSAATKSGVKKPNTSRWGRDPA